MSDEYSSLSTHHSVLITQYSSLSTHHSVLITHHSDFPRARYLPLIHHSNAVTARPSDLEAHGTRSLWSREMTESPPEVATVHDEYTHDKDRRCPRYTDSIVR